MFSPARYDALPGMAFPAPAFSYPTKDEVAAYLEAYAVRFDLPVVRGVRADGLARSGDRYLVTAGARRYEADQVVVASGAHHTPRLPAFASKLDPRIAQLHSSQYRNPHQLGEGGVLVIGAATSGAEIACEVARTRPTWLSGRDVGQSPLSPGSIADKLFTPAFWFFASRVVTTSTPWGRRIRTRILSMAAPLERVRRRDIAAAGIERVPKTIGVRDGSPALDDDRVLDVSTVIWCTGFRPDFGWIDVPVFDNDGMPQHRRGVVEASPGLYFVGLHLLHSLTSAFLGGVGADAAYIARHIATRAVRVERGAIKPALAMAQDVDVTNPRPSR